MNPTIIRGDARAIQYALIFVHWWWVYVLAQDVDLFAAYHTYYTLAWLGDQHEWLVRSIVVAACATLCLTNIPAGLRALFCGMQAAWLSLIAVLFLLLRPSTTGPGPYAACAMLGVVLAVESWRARARR